MDTTSSFTQPSIETGFTLIELLVVVVMLSVLLIGLIFTFNPLSQINKAKDLQREHNLAQIKTALDSYYNDKGCYPTSLTFGTSWTSGQTTYMTKVPQDPDYVSGSSIYLPYIYQTDGSSCPQWNVLYSGLRGPASTSTACALSQRTSCLPQGFNQFYNFCLSSGAVDCSVISSSVLQTGGGGNGGGGGGAGNPTATPTPTPYIVNCPNQSYFGCTGDNRCNSVWDQAAQAPTQCQGYGGTLQCYCDSLCRVNGIKQCAN